MTEDNRWIAKNFASLVDAHGGRYVAVVNKKVVASGDRPHTVEARAQKLTGAKTPETRQRRIEKALALFREGRKR